MVETTNQSYFVTYGGFINAEYPQMNGLQWKIPIKTDDLFRRYPYCRKPPYILFLWITAGIGG